jgi:hypothetical protein
MAPYYYFHGESCALYHVLFYDYKSDLTNSNQFILTNTVYDSQTFFEYNSGKQKRIPPKISTTYGKWKLDKNDTLILFPAYSTKIIPEFLSKQIKFSIGNASFEKD